MSLYRRRSSILIPGLISGALIAGLAALSLTGCETIYRGVSGPGRGSNPASASNGAATAPAYADDGAKLAACEGVAGCLSVLTFNTKHRDVPVQSQATYRKLKADFPRLPDFLLLQEVVYDRPTKNGALDNTAAEMAAALGCNVYGEARDGGSEGVAILSPHPFAFTDRLHLKARDGLLSGGFPRVSIMAESNVPGIGLVRVVNVHLTQRPSQNEIRIAQLKETLDWMNARQSAARADVIILGGDFNSHPDWSDRALVKDPSACGGVQFHDFNSATATSGNVGDPYERVDYFYVGCPDGAASGGVSNVGERILWRGGIPTLDNATTFWPSDHLPLMQVYAVGPSATSAGY